MRPFLLTALLVTAILAGCTDAPDDSDDGVDPGTGGTGGNNTTVAPKVFEGTGVVTSAAAAGTGSEALAFTVDDGATLVHAELAWDDPVVDLDLALASPSAEETQGVQSYDHSAEGGSPGAPDSPHSLTLTDAETGDWQATAFANGAAAEVEYRVAVTVFYGETAVPDGYTAL